MIPLDPNAQTIILPTIYNDVIYPQDDKKVYVFYGSRKGGKTEGIARGLLLRGAYNRDLKIFAARETQDEFNTTLMLVFKDIIRNDPEYQFLKPFVKFFKDRIEISSSGSVIWFVGLSEKTKDRVKGIKADIFWFDEAHDMSADTYDFLIPSIREKGSKVIISFNPQYDYDFVAKEFLQNPAPNVKVIKINASDNPYIDEESERQIAIDRERMPYERYLWKWEGGFKPQSETALFDIEAIRAFPLNIPYNRDDYSRIVIGIDPAMTHKDFNNETGVVVVGLDHKGRAVLLNDASGHLRPNALASLVSDLYHQYNAHAVVVETNQGGEYVKNTILSTDSTLRVIEVRAKQDKVNRMLPIANEVYMGKIVGLNDRVSEFVALQFRKFSNNGYLGAKGESPDRAEAFAWACFELLGISEYDTEQTFFTAEMLTCENEGIVSVSNVAYAYIGSSEYAVIVFDVHSLVISKTIKIKKAVIGKMEDFRSDIAKLGITNLRANLCPISQNALLGLSTPYSLYQSSKMPIDDKAQTIAPFIKGFVNASECELFEYQGIKTNWIMRELMRFKIGEDKDSVLLSAFCDMILQEKKLN